MGPSVGLVALVLALSAAALLVAQRGMLSTPARATVTEPALDGLRGLAALAVFGFHLAHLYIPYGIGEHPPLIWWPVTASNVSVDLFFVLSGFLLQRSWKPGASAGHFAARRAARILPAYWVWLAITVPVMAPHLLQPESWRKLALFVSAQPWMVPTLPGEVSVVTWTLTVETQFYVILPLAAIAMRRLGPMRVAAVILGCSLAWRFAMMSGGQPWPMDWLPGRMDQFALGMAAGIIADRRAGRPLGPTATAVRLSAMAAMGVLLCFNGWIGLAKPAHLDWWLHPLAGLLIATLISTMRTSSGLFSWRPLVLCGRISYGLYLWHAVFVVQPLLWGWSHAGPRPGGSFTIALVVAGSFAAAALSYALIERPVLEATARSGRRVRPARTPRSVLGPEEASIQQITRAPDASERRRPAPDQPVRPSSTRI